MEYLNIIFLQTYKILFLLVPVLVSVAMIVWLDRRIWAFVQKRQGPNVVGPFGLLQSLADALTNYEGTVIFTSHDRHYTKTVATSIIEVRDSRVTIYSGQYDNYLYKVNKEIEAGERELASQKAKKQRMQW